MKYSGSAVPRSSYKSHPARGAWIEMVRLAFSRRFARVAPRKGCVD